MKNVFIVDHPLVQHKLTYCRQEKTMNKEFRAIVEEISTLILYEATRSFALTEIEVRTPISLGKGKVLAQPAVLFVPILRSGLVMLNAALRMVPTAKVGHLGFFRDPMTFSPVEYYRKLPSDVENRKCFVLDVMIATGGTAIAAVNSLKERGAETIKYISLVAAREGLHALNRTHPDVEIYLADIDEELNADAFLVPGLGDAGDRLYGTD